MLSTLRGIASGLLLAINLLLWAIIILVVAGIAKILPSTLKNFCMRFALQLPTYWMHCNKWVLQISTYKKWNIHGSGSFKKNGWYLLLANHASWMDIPVLGVALADKIPLIKFFMKKSLLWTLPIAGLDCYLLGYPFMERHTRSDIRKNPKLKGKDIETTKQACQAFKEHPTTFMNFVEGTRFSTEKRDRQSSPYQHLLKPKSAGIAIVANELIDKLDGIINATIIYDANKTGLWDFLCGRVKQITVYYELIDPNTLPLGNYHEDRQYRKSIQEWLNNIWTKKDALISSNSTLITSDNDNH